MNAPLNEPGPHRNGEPTHRGPAAVEAARTPDDPPRPRPSTDRGPRDRAGRSSRQARAKAKRQEDIDNAATPADPPSRSNRKGPWLVLAVCLLLVLPTLVLELDSPDVAPGDEAEAVARSVETYARFTDITDPTATLYERLRPQFNGQADLTVHPLVTWTHMLGYALIPDRTEAQTPAQWRVFQARLVSVLLAFVVIGSVYWAGHSLGGSMTAVIAALICATNPLFIIQAREGSEPIHYVAWTLLAIAAALWAIRPLKPQPSIERQFIGWVTCGLAIGAATLTSGPPAVLGIVLPVGLILVLCPNRMGHLMGLIAAGLIGFLLPMPWAVYAHENDRNAWPITLDALFPSEALVFQGFANFSSLYLLLLIAVLLPWTVWLLGAVIQPFSTSSSGNRTRQFLAWSWFAITLFATALLTRGRLADLLPLVPVTSVLLAQLFAQYSDLAAEGRYPRFWRWGKWVHLSLLAVASLGVLSWPWLRDGLMQQAVIDRSPFGPMPPYVWVLLGVALLAILGLSVRWMVNNFPGRVAVCWALWGMAAAPILTLAWAHGPRAYNPLTDEAILLDMAQDDVPAYWVNEPYTGAAAPDPAFLLFAGRPIQPIAMHQLNELHAEEGSYYLLAPGKYKADDVEARRLATAPALGRDLWFAQPPRLAPEAEPIETDIQLVEPIDAPDQAAVPLTDGPPAEDSE